MFFSPPSLSRCFLFLSSCGWWDLGILPSLYLSLSLSLYLSLSLSTSLIYPIAFFYLFPSACLSIHILCVYLSMYLSILLCVTV